MVTVATVAPSVVAVVVLVGLSAFFSSSETAIFSLPETWGDALGATDEPRVATLQELRADPHRLLVTVLVGNNVVNVAIASITTVLVTDHLPAGSAVTVATILASVCILVFGEIVPKSYGLANAERWALTVARPLALVERLLYPLVVGFDAVTRWLNGRIGGEGDIERPYVEK